MPPFDGNESLWERVVWRAATTPDALFAVDEHGARMSFARLHHDAEAVASALHAVGVASGSVVAWQLPTCLETLVLIAALARLDCTQVPLLASYGSREVDHACTSTGAARLLRADTLRSLPPVDPARLAPHTRAAGNPVRWVFHTSGTSALPKGVLHSDATTFAAARAWSIPAEITDRDRTTLNFPVAHIGGLSLYNIALDTGAPMVVLERFVPDLAVEVFERERVTLAGAGPAFFAGYLEVQRRTPQRRILADVRVFPSGGAPKSPALHAELVEVFGVGIASNYGLTECPNVTGTPMDAPDNKRACAEGKAAPGVDLSVRDGSGCEVPRGHEGELWVRGPQRCLGYVDCTLDAEAVDERGFFRTGDLVRIDEDNYVHVVGRVKDIIIRKGENISAREVEDLLAQHELVSDVAVVGLPDPERGELCCAVVVPRNPTEEPTLPQLRSFLLERGLMVQKIPERLEVVEALPRFDGYGKIIKSELRERFGAL